MTKIISPQSLTINNKEFKLQDIVNQYFISDDLNDFEKHTLDLCHRWLKGGKNFKIPTSGSTGTPKKIAISRERMQISAAITARELKLKPNGKMLVCLPTRFIAGIMMLVRGFETPMQMTIIEPSGDPLQFLDEDFDFISMVPQQLETTIKKHGYDKLDKTAIILLGGAPVSVALLDRIQELKPLVYESYGMTETVTHIALKRLNGENAADIFCAFPEVHIGTDERGCLTIESVLSASRKIITNDLVELVEENCFRWLGRWDHMINSGGIKVSPEIVEPKIQKILESIGVQMQFVIIGKKDQLLGEMVCLVLEGNDLESSMKEKILQLAKSELGPYHSPKEILFLPTFPLTETAKVKRKDLSNLLFS